MLKMSFFYVLSNVGNSVLYTGVTSDLTKRLLRHREGSASVFTRKYKTTKLVYYESFGDITYAIAREKQIKAGSRQKKIDLIKSVNPEWRDLSQDFE